MSPTNIGLFCSGMIFVTIRDDPEKMPADPLPAIARPMMKAVEFGAPPQSAEPTSKVTTAQRKTSLVE